MRYLLLLACCLFGRCDAATLHAFIVADTLDPSIGPGVVVDRELLHDEVIRIAYYAHMDLSETIIDGEDYDPILIKTLLRNLQTAPDDAVVYFHCSHGFRVPQMEERWPALFFGWAQWALRLDDITDILRTKPHRFTLVFADTCNNLIEDHHAPRLLPVPMGRGGDNLQQMYQKLYRQSHGMVVASGSKPGQFAWVDLDQGSFFTLNFLYSLKECARVRLYDWKVVMQLASQNTLHWTQSIDDEDITEQEPQFAIELR